MGRPCKVPQPINPSLRYVRCLGYGKEHWFKTDDTCRHRVCPKCRLKQGSICQQKVVKVLNRGFVGGVD